MIACLHIPRVTKWSTQCYPCLCFWFGLSDFQPFCCCIMKQKSFLCAYPVQTKLAFLVSLFGCLFGMSVMIIVLGINIRLCLLLLLLLQFVVFMHCVWVAICQRLTLCSFSFWANSCGLFLLTRFSVGGLLMNGTA